MGMSFSPMYAPSSTTTIKADGDLNINPYDLLATDVKCDTAEASEFVGGVGNFTKVIGSLVIPWTSTTSTTNVSLMPIKSETISGNTSGWRTVHTFNVNIPANPTYGLKYDNSITSFYSSINCSNLYGVTDLKCQLRVNGIEYPIHDIPSGLYSFTENNVLFNIGSNVVEFYSSAAVNRTYTIQVNPAYIALV